MEKADFERLQSLDKQFHIHPFTHHPEMHVEGTNVITRAEGCWLWDQQGRKLLDGLAGLWCVNVGYGRREIIDAVTQQMEQLPYYCSFFNTTNKPAIELSAKLASMAPGRLRHTLFCSSGSEANETALKLIRGWNKLRGRSAKTKILSRSFSYHGVTLATASLTGLPTVNTPFDLPLPGFIHVPGPNAYAANTSMTPEAYGQWCIEETAKTIDREGASTIAALFAEPIQGAGGVIVPPQGYLQALRKLCREKDILFVADEVITGFGRLGQNFGSEIWDLDPDIMTLAKGITSGYLPLGATMISDELANDLLKPGYLAHGFTYSSHPTCAAAALANLSILENDKLVARVRDDVGPYFQQKLRSFIGHPAVGEARGHGLIGALELLPPGGRAGLKPDMALGARAAKIARGEGVIVRGIRDLIAVSPPFVVTRGEIDQLFDAVRASLDKLWR